MAAVTLSALALTACSQQAPSPDAWGLNHFGSVKAADVIPELIAALRSQLKPDPVAGVDFPAVYAAMDKQLAPVLADSEALLVQAPQQIGLAPSPSVKGTAAQSAGQAYVALLAADVPGREYLINKTYDAGEHFTGGGMVEDVKGVNETYVENGEVVIHWDMNGEATKVTGEGDAAQTSVLVQSLLVGESVDKDGNKTGQKTYVEACPDVGGLSHGKLYFQLAAGGHVDGPAGQHGGQATFIVTADLLGHVDDSATLTSYDLNNLSIQRSATGSASSDPAGFFADGVSLTGVAPASLEGTAWNSGGNAVAGPSARTAIHNMKQADVQREIGLMVVFAKFHVQEMFRIAEKEWRAGRCVKVVATKGPDPKRLGPGQTTHFSIEVFHKPDNAKLDVPVVAASHDGRAQPEGRPVMPPAQFSFTAASGKPKSYTVDLKSTSRRGIGELRLNFSPLQPYELTIIDHVGPTVPGGPPASMAKITGRVAPDPTDTFLVGPGTAEGHVYVNSDLGCPGSWVDAGLRTFTVELRALDKGDGTFDVQVTSATFGGTNLGGDAPITVGTFPVGGGEQDASLDDTSFGSGTLTTTDECMVDNPVTLTTVSSFTIQADPDPT